VERVASALGRAFAFWCGSGQPDLEKLIHRIAWELQHSVSSDGTAVAIIARMKGGPIFVGKSFEVNVLPVETLLGMIAEVDSEQVSCRVWDHALDAVRFIESRYRTSILARIPVPSSFAVADNFVLWCGTSGVASQEAIERTTAMAQALAAWLEIYYPAIDSLQRLGKAQQE